MILIVQNAESPDPVRQKEYDFCLRRNVANKLFSKILVVEGRPTYREHFKKAGEMFPREIVALANSDIIFDESILLANSRLGKKDVWALTRWEPGASGPFTRQWNTQDVWVFHSPLPEIPADFCLGFWACDDRIAQLLLDAGLNVTNPSDTVRTVHWHKSNVRTSGSREDKKIPGPWASILPSELPPILDPKKKVQKIR